jgi:hypothetical protein
MIDILGMALVRLQVTNQYASEYSGFVIELS